MENRIMRKHLIGTILVLAALAACNKEIDTQTPAIVDPVEETPAGKVTLTFKATIGEETRTVYANDKTASWAAGDKISVRVTDGTNFETAKFSTTDGETFTGQVTNGYTTIVSGVYPANDNHVFSDGSVQSVYLPDTYDLGTANDGGIALPMVGEMKNGAFTFHHICGALKIEIVDIFNALTFTTAETITGSFELNADGSIEIPANGDGSTVTFNYGRLETNPAIGERGNRTFYIPVPLGTVSAGATMALKNSNDVTVYEKTTSSPITFSSKIMRMSALELQTPDEWRNYITEAVSGEKGKYTFHVTTGTEYVILFTLKSNFESNYHGSVAEFIEKKALGNTKYSVSSTFTMSNTMNSYFGKEYIVLNCAVKTVGENRHITFDYCLLDYEFPTVDYLQWIGEWAVSYGSASDTWTITRDQVNHSYHVKGLCGTTTNAMTVEGLLTENGNLLFKTQAGFGHTTYNNYDTTLNLYRRKTETGSFNSNNDVDLMLATLESATSATLAPCDATYSYYTLIGTYTNSNGENKTIKYGTTRLASTTMTKQ
jgi:hypothetical protein